jgi:uncharacterized protein YceH (UPF0502 family)
MSTSHDIPTISRGAQIARELHRADLIKSFTDYSKVADRLQRNASKEEILQLDELKRWKEAWQFLADRL